jgi:cytochrome P450
MRGLAHLARFVYYACASKGDLAEALTRLVTNGAALTLPLGLGPQHAIVTADPTLIRQLLVSEADRFHKMPHEAHVLGPVMDGGLILLEGNGWAARRQGMAVGFSPDLMPHVLALTMAVTAARAERWSGSVNISHEARCIVHDLTARFFGGGAPVGCLRGEENADASARQFAQIERELERRVWDPLGVVRRLRRLAGRPSLLEHDAPWRAAIHQRATCPSAASGTERDPLHRLQARLGSADTVSRELSTLVAASATSVHHLAWTCHLLAAHPDIQERLSNEITGAAREGHLRDGTHLADVEALPYLSAVINESLRLYPPAPFMFREGAGKRPYVIAIWAMHRHPRFWDRPDEFSPERWLTPSETPAYMPFGLGARVCIARRFALIESRGALIEVVRRYRLDAAGAAPKPTRLIMTRPARDIRINVSSRQAR